MSWVEIAGFVTGALCVWLVVRRNVLNFAVGMANNVFFLVLFLQAGLYADAWLQVVYFALAAIGWYWWLHGGANRTALVVRRTPAWGWPAVGAFVTFGAWLLWLVLTSHTDSTVPVGDALTTSLSLGAQLMLNRKWIGNWLVWIAADVIYIGLYVHKELYLTAVLYGLFLTLCVIGLVQWRATMAGGERSERLDASADPSRHPAGSSGIGGGPPMAEGERSERLEASTEGFRS